MNTQQATLHMALAAYLAPDPHEQVRRIAKRVSKRTISKRTKATMQHVISSPVPAAVALYVYEEEE